MTDPKSCSSCQQVGPDGLQCDTCQGWHCRRCIDPAVLTQPLYQALTTKGEFPWMCANCSTHGVYFQLMNSGTFQWDELIRLECNPLLVDEARRQVATPTQNDPNPATPDVQPDASTTTGTPPPTTNDGPTTAPRTSHADATLGQPSMMPNTQNAANNEPDGMMRMFMAMQQQQNQFVQQMVQIQHNNQVTMMQSQQQLASMIQNLNISANGSVPATNDTSSPVGARSFPQQNARPTPISTAASLPRLQLPQFDGDFLKWNNFWESFDINVNQQNLHDKQKLDYLHQLLRGPAYDKIKGLGLESSKYGEAIATLKQHYGNPAFQRKAQWDAFHALPMVRDNLANLEKFTDEARAIVTSLERQGTPKAALDVLVSEVMKKLPLYLVSKFNEVRVWNHSNDGEIKIDDVLQFLRQYHEVQLLSANQAKPNYDRQAGPPQISKHTQPGPRALPTANFNQQAHPSKMVRKCVFCAMESHFSDECKKVASLDERKQRLANEGRCFNCLGTGHLVRNCPRNKRCFICKQPGHHTAICPKPRTTQRTAQLNQNFIADESTDDNETIAFETSMVNAQMNLSSTCKDDIMMAAFPCVVTNPKTKECHELLIYVDGGARLTCISQEAASKLNLKPRKEVSLAVSRFNADNVDVIKANVVRAQLNGINGFGLDIEAYAVAKTAPAFKVSPIRLNKHGINKIRQLKPLNRPPQRQEERPADILIGQDYHNAIMGPQFKATKVQNQMYIHHTPLGNVLCGNANPISKQKSDTLETTCLLNPSTVCDPVERLWQLEAIGINSPDQGMFATKNQRMIDEFNSKITVKDGRYEVGLPWKSLNTHLPTNYHLAKGRLESTLRTLAPNGQPTAMFNAYNDVIQDQLKNGIVEPVTVNQQDGSVKHYLAHFPVIKKDHATTKVRIVYDASARTKHDKSLNDMVYIGPCLLNDLAGILLRFRTCSIAMVADIEKAFLQVGLQMEDRDAVRFLWLKDPSKPVTQDNLQILRFTRVPFGVGASPFLLGATVKFHLEQCQTSVSNAIKRNIYVDNVIMGAEDISGAIRNYTTGKSLFNGASMNLREWMSSDQNFNASLDSSDRSKSTTMNVLGMIWNASDDLIRINGMCGASQEVTRRTVAQDVAKWFDPLGLVSPLLIRAKIFNQKMWKADLKWDDSLPCDLKAEWNELKVNFKDISTISLDRRCLISRNQPVTLCCFTDSSESAYAAAVYVRQEVNGQVSSQLVFAKGRVTPIKPKLTIPQLELTAVVIGARAMKFVVDQCDLQIDGMYLWSDSQIVLHWLHSAKDLTPYVERRKQEILKMEMKFGYVGTKENPADLGTRGCSAQRLISSNWLHGPAWLQQPPAEWSRWSTDVPEGSLTTKNVPTNAPDRYQSMETNFRSTSGDQNFTSGFSKNPRNGFPMVDSGSKIELPVTSVHFRSKSTTSGQTGSCSTSLNSASESKPMLQNVPTEVDPVPNAAIFDCSRRSTLQSMLRVVAYTNRFINRLHKRPIPSSAAITTEEIKQAWWTLVKQYQQQHFNNEMKLLERGKQNQIIKQLDLMIKDGVIRCGGRLGNAFPKETAIPILLAKNNSLTTLVVQDAHAKVFHYGAKSTLAQIRKTCWIAHGYSQVRKILMDCTICRRSQGGAFRPPRMAPLPKERVQRSSAFQHTGLDYMGPLMIRSEPGTDHKKRWIAIFTCFSTRAVHLEVVNDCSTESAIQAILRFIGRRGTPHTILTDNATQFKKSDRVLDAIWNNQPRDDVIEDLVKFFADQRINWKFIPEGSPWVGGFYERLVGVVKRALRKLFWKTTVKMETFVTMLAQLEGIINTRPLLQMDADQKEYNPLTPAHFIAPSSQLVAPPSDEDADDPEYFPLPARHPKRTLLKQWNQIEKKLDQFWTIWQNQYLHELRECHQTRFKPKPGDIMRPAIEGEICLLKDATPRATWKLIRVIELIDGSDGEIRFAKVKFPTGHITRRALKDLVPLEAHSREETPEQAVITPVNAPAADCRGTTNRLIAIFSQQRFMTFSYRYYQYYFQFDFMFQVYVIYFYFIRNIVIFPD